VRSDAERWDLRWSELPATDLVDTRVPAAFSFEPSRLLVRELLDRLRREPDLADGPLRALDLACGTGYETAWAAELGFAVDAVDVSSVAIDRTRSRVGRLGLADRVRARVVDLDEGLPADLAGPYYLVLCQRFRVPSLYPALLAVTAPGGLLGITVLSQVGLRGDPGPFHAPPGELVTAYAALPTAEVLCSFEADGEASLVVRRRVDPASPPVGDAP
jgi:SAM-dependent methyltransferase